MSVVRFDPVEAEPTICLPSDAVPADQIAFAQCDIFEKKNASYRVRCRVCYRQFTTSCHKMIYGHYLHQPHNSIVTCVAREKLQLDHPEFYQSLVLREEKLGYKRK
jgi:hypothetical protein